MVQPRRLRVSVRPRDVVHAALLGVRGGVRAAEAHPGGGVPVRREGVDVPGLHLLGRCVDPAAVSRSTLILSHARDTYPDTRTYFRARFGWLVRC